MTATPLTVTQMDHKTALNITLADTPGTNADNVNGNSIANGGKVLLVMNNTGGSSATVSVAYGSTYDGQTVPALQFTIPAGKVSQAPLGTPAQFGQSTLVTASASTVKLAAYAMP
jgi:hypothetical protein